jgi:phage recombination protein Bet
LTIEQAGTNHQTGHDMTTALTTQQDRASLVRVLESSLYPGAQPQSIEMVIGYCHAAGLDPMLKPVHIVPMWDSKAGRMRDVVMPGVGLYRTQASRTGQFAGMSEPEFGPDVNAKIGGQDVTYPEWCRVTVRRALSSGVVAEFTAREYWLENYAVKGGKEKSVAPNAMWTKRPRGQLAKCASAQALRIAFPELGAAPTADEMEGKTLMDAADVLPVDQPRDFGLSSARAKIIRAAAGAAIQKFNEGNEWGAYEEVSGITDGDEKEALWSVLKPHSALRSALKRCAQEERDRARTVDVTPVLDLSAWIDRIDNALDKDSAIDITAQALAALPADTDAINQAYEAAWGDA